MAKLLPSTKPKMPDLPIIIERLAKEGYTVQSIAEYSNTSREQLNRIKTESLEVPKNWYTLYLILDLYIRTIGTPVPMYGNHNE